MFTRNSVCSLTLGFMVENLSNMDLFVTWEARIIAKVAKLRKIYYYLYKAEWLWDGLSNRGALTHLCSGLLSWEEMIERKGVPAGCWGLPVTFNIRDLLWASASHFPNYNESHLSSSRLQEGWHSVNSRRAGWLVLSFLTPRIITVPLKHIERRKEHGNCNRILDHFGTYRSQGR